MQFISFMRTLFCFLTIALSQTTYAEEHTIPPEGIEVINILEAAKDVILSNQSVINGPSSDKYRLFNQHFLVQLKTHYQARFNTPFPPVNTPLLSKLIESILAVMESNRALIYDTKVNEKGLIPAVFMSDLTNILSNSGMSIKMSWTAPNDLLLNELNKPTQWEQNIFAQYTRSNSPIQGIYVTQTQGNYRLFSPLFYHPQCKDCHRRFIKYTGNAMRAIKDGEFAGGITVSFNENALKPFIPDETERQYVPLKNSTNTTKIRVGISEHASHSKLVESNITGHWVEFLNELETRTHFQFEFIPITSGRLQTALMMDSIDIAFPIFEADLKNIQHVSRTPLLYENPGFCYLPENFTPFNALSSVWKDKLIIASQGEPIVPFVQANAKNLLKVSGKDVQSRMLNILKMKRADAIYLNDVHSVYRMSSEHYQSLVCNPFTKYSTPLYLAARSSLPKARLNQLRHVFESTRYVDFLNTMKQ